jgi:hypothetical protein
MLNLPIAMLKLALALFILFQDTPLAITSPLAGDTLRGQVQISGGMNMPGFSSAELAFSYAASESADVWFAIQTFSQPPADSVFAIWDTAAITDGDYNLRLRVFLEDGTTQEVIVSDLKIRNDTSEAPATPTEGAFPQFIATTPPPARTEPTPSAVAFHPTSTSLPPNPASVTVEAIQSTFGRGALIALGLFAFLSLILRLRKNT